MPGGGLVDNKKKQIIVLCEDQKQQIFIRTLLVRLGYHKRKLRFVTTPAGKQSGEQYVRNCYADQVRAIRKYGGDNMFLFVMIDADDKNIQDRMNELNMVLTNNHINPRSETDHIVILIPKRNIETWIYFLDGNDVDEYTDYKLKSITSPINEIIDQFIKLYRDQFKLSSIPPSMNDAFVKLRKIKSAG